MTLRARIFLGFLLVQLASAALVLGWYFYSLQAELGAVTRSNAEEAVLNSVKATEDYFLPAETLAEEGRFLLSAGLLGRDRPAQLERYFFEQLQRWPQLSGLYVGYPDGGFFYVMRSDQESSGGMRTKIIEPGSEGRHISLTWRDQSFKAVRSEEDPEDTFDPRSRSWFQDAVERRANVWTEPYVFFTSRKPGITLAAPATGDDGEVIAVFGVDIEMSEISGFLTRNSLGLRGSAFITTAEGQVIAHSSADVVAQGGAGDGELRFRRIEELGGLEAGISARVLSLLSQGTSPGPASVWEESLEDGDTYIAAGRMSEVNWPWLLVVTAPKTGQLEAGRSSALVLVAVILLATALACLVGFAVSRRVGKVLTTLHRNALLARNGNVELLDREATGFKEIDEIAETLIDFALAHRQGRGAGSGGGPGTTGD